MSPTRVAVIGLGRFGEEHLRVYQNLAEAELVGIYDPDFQRATEVAQRYEVPTFGSVTELVTKAQPTAVSLVVPARHNAEVLSEIAESECAVLVEKPLAPDSETALAQRLRLDPRRHVVGHIVRFAAPYRQLQEAEATHEGAVHGESTRIRPADHLDDYPTENIVNLTMIHDLDAVLWMTGERVTAVSTAGKQTSDGRWSSVSATLSLSGGGSWQCHAHWIGATARDSMSVSGRTIELGPTVSTFVDVDGQTTTYPGIEATYDAALKTELQHFISTVRHGKPSRIFNLDNAVEAVQVADAVKSSLAQGGEKIALA